MHSAIVVASPPETEADKQRWQLFLASIELLKSNPAVDELAENVWLVNFEQSPAALARLLSAGQQHQFSQRILRLPDEPKWLRAEISHPTNVRDPAWERAY